MYGLYRSHDLQNKSAISTPLPPSVSPSSVGFSSPVSGSIINRYMPHRSSVSGDDIFHFAFWNLLKEIQSLITDSIVNGDIENAAHLFFEFYIASEFHSDHGARNTSSFCASYLLHAFNSVGVMDLAVGRMTSQEKSSLFTSSSINSPG